MTSGRGAAPREAHLSLTPCLSRGRRCKGTRARKVLAQDGHTLLEMIIVVALLAVIAAIAMPSATPAHHQKLDLAASEVADAFRFAREESRRTSVIHGVAADLSNTRPMTST